MDPRDRSRIADPTIAEVFSEFLEEQRARLARRTFRNYEDVIGLFEHCLDGYGYQQLDKEDRALFERLYEAGGEDHREFTEIFGPEHVLENVGEFLGYFMEHKVMGGKELLRASGTVTKKLAKWLEENGFAGSDAAGYAVERGAEAARNLPAADDLLRMLDGHAEGGYGSGGDEEGHFEFTRVEPGRIWVRDLGGPERGPIRLPRGVTDECHVGWSFSGALCRRGRSWRIAEVWKVHPAP